MNRPLSEAAVNAGFDAFHIFTTSKVPKLIEAYQVACDAPTKEQRDMRFYLIGWMDGVSQVVTLAKGKRLTVGDALEEAQRAKDHFYRLVEICKEQIAAAQRGETLPQGAILKTIEGLVEIPREFRDEGFFVLGWVDRLEIFRQFRDSPEQHRRN